MCEQAEISETCGRALLLVPPKPASLSRSSSADLWVFGWVRITEALGAPNPRTHITPQTDRQTDTMPPYQPISELSTIYCPVFVCVCTSVLPW